MGLWEVLEEVVEAVEAVREEMRLVNVTLEKVFSSWFWVEKVFIMRWSRPKEGFFPFIWVQILGVCRETASICEDDHLVSKDVTPGRSFAVRQLLTY